MSEFGWVKTEYNGRIYKSKFEAFFAAYLDLNCITFQYEPKPVRLSDGRMYYPDFLIKEEDGSEIIDHYIEVKGGSGERVESGLNKVSLFSCEESILVFGPKWPRSMAEMINDFANDNRFHSTMYWYPPEADKDPKFALIQGLWYPLIDLDDLNEMPEKIRKAFEKFIDAALAAAYKHIQSKGALEPKGKAEATEWLRTEGHELFSLIDEMEKESAHQEEEKDDPVSDTKQPEEEEEQEKELVGDKMSRATYWIKNSTKKMISDIAYTKRYTIQYTINELLEIGIDVALGRLRRDCEELLHRPKGDFE